MQLRGVIFSRNSALQQADYTQISSLFAQLRMFTTVQLGIANHHTFGDRKVTLITTFISTLHLSQIPWTIYISFFVHYYPNNVHLYKSDAKHV